MVAPGPGTEQECLAGAAISWTRRAISSAVWCSFISLLSGGFYVGQLSRRKVHPASGLARRSGLAR